jgi:IS1 family transposase
MAAESLRLTMLRRLSILSSVNRLSTFERASIVRALIEGNSIRATARLTGTNRETVMRLLSDLGASCDVFQGGALRNIASRRIECDEIWSFVGAKARNVPEKRRDEYGIGDVYTWVALDPDSKLVLTWRVGQRTADDAERFMADLASRVAGRIQLTTDGYSPYVTAVLLAFGRNVDFAQLVKEYGRRSDNDYRYSPPEIVKSKKHIVFGSPNERLISTSHVERQNLTMRMKMRRMTRLTNAFSKKIESLENAVALHFMDYNFCRIHQTLGKTPAMAAGIADHQWTAEEIVGLLAGGRVAAEAA